MSGAVRLFKAADFLVAIGVELNEGHGPAFRPEDNLVAHNNNRALANAALPPHFLPCLKFQTGERAPTGTVYMVANKNAASVMIRYAFVGIYFLR